MVIKKVTGQGELKYVYSKFYAPSNINKGTICITNILNSFENKHLATSVSLVYKHRSRVQLHISL